MLPSYLSEILYTFPLSLTQVFYYEQYILLFCEKHLQLSAAKKGVRKFQATTKILRKNDDFGNFLSHSAMSKYTESYGLSRGSPFTAFNKFEEHVSIINSNTPK